MSLHRKKREALGHLITLIFILVLVVMLIVIALPVDFHNMELIQ